MKFRNDSGSLTLEACIVVPIFIIIMLFVNGFFIMFMGQQIITHTIVQSAKSLCLDPYAAQRVAADAEDKLGEMALDIFGAGDIGHSSNEKWYEEDNIEDVVKDRFVVYLKNSTSEDAANSLLQEIGIEDGIDGIDFSGSSVDENGILTVKIKYRQKYVLSAMDIAPSNMEMSVKVKLFEYYEIED